MGKRHRKAIRRNVILRELAPQRFGHSSIDTVTCLYCGVKQCSIDIISSDGKVRRASLIECHHIYPFSKHPEMMDEPDNVIFLCSKHHREFHRRYDPKPVSRVKGENVSRTPASITALQKFLGLTAKETVAYYQNWTEDERNAAKVKDGYYFYRSQLESTR